MKFLFLAVTVLVLNSCGFGVRGELGKACMASGRSAANSALCSCVQQTANQNLSGRDQKLAATFFDEPQKAQDIRQSDRSADEAFWARYKSFTDRAQRQCR
ncbi:arginine transporter [Loktanella sp. SALINAS62]|uniref:arginine transporter n=1 Tax=Loktanella sp. SALINAS62 TaxID=2706124 RepID=UPI001B8B2330|nr:arginine transporter [Loktanella sp. SALINAS62]MBS1303977.1 arginine transporter [Loktanella sp. SALINAS62]